MLLPVQKTQTTTVMPTNPLKVFTDTNIFVALLNKNDSTHARALKLLDFLEENQAILFTSSDVIGETLTVMARKLGKKQAIDFLAGYKISGIKEIFIDEEIQEDAQKLFLKVRSKLVSFIDCSSAVAIQQNKIPYAFTFDKQFKGLGVKLLEELVNI